MNLPYDAEQDEVRGEIGIGVTGLVLGALLLVAIVVGGLFLSDGATVRHIEGCARSTPSR
jgi:hypothetical protein